MRTHFIKEAFEGAVESRWKCKGHQTPRKPLASDQPHQTASVLRLLTGPGHFLLLPSFHFSVTVFSFVVTFWEDWHKLNFSIEFYLSAGTLFKVASFLLFNTTGRKHLYSLIIASVVLEKSCHLFLLNIWGVVEGSTVHLKADPLHSEVPQQLSPQYFTHWLYIYIYI